MYRTARRAARRAALCPMSGIGTVRPPKGGWRRDDPGTGGDGSSGHGNAGGGGTNDGGSGEGDGGKAADKTPKIEGDFDRERHERALAAAREGEKTAKAAKKAADDKLAGVLKLLGVGADGKADPETQVKSLTERAEAAEQRANALAIRDAVRTAAAKHGADPELLLDSQKFLGQLADLDPSATDYADKVSDKVKAAVKDNTRYATTPAAKGGGKSGSADHTGGTGGQQRPTSIREAYARKTQ